MSPGQEFGPVRVEIAERVATVTLDRGDGLNALSVAALEGLKAAALFLKEDVATSAVVLTGSRVFSAGADLIDAEHRRRRDAPLMQKREYLRLGPDTCAAWEALDQVTIVAIENFCLGGALAIAVACDLRIAGEGAHLRLPEIPLGFNLNWNATPRVTALIGPARAKRLIILGERVYAPEALEWGLIDELCDDGRALEQAQALANRIAMLPPIPVRMAKRSITAHATALDRLTSHMDNDQYILSTLTSDNEEAIQAFLDKRSPKFTGT